MPQGHTGLWPRYQPKRRERIIACFDGALLTDENGLMWEIHTWAELTDRVMENSYDVYVTDLLDPAGFPFLWEALADPDTTLNASASGGALGIRYRRAKRTRTIGLARTWGAEIGGAFTRQLRGLFDYVGIGTYTTPGALGEALWAGLRTERMSVPNISAGRDLRIHAFGGRDDTPGLGRKLPQAYETDLRSAYVALCARVPTGTAERILGETSHERYAAATYYARCHVQLPARRMAAYSPVPYREVTGRGESSALQYPNAGPFEFEAWLWREEVRRARDLGIRVEVREGWSWPWWDTDNAAWIDRITGLRYYAPVGKPEFDEWLKLAALAAIGRHAMPPVKYELLADGDPRLTEEDIPLVSNTPGTLPITGIWLHSEPDSHPAARLPHLWNYVTMRCRVALYDRMELERKAGNSILMTNFDSILLEQATSLPTADAPGSWRQTILHNVEIVGPRSIVSDEKTRLPGVKRDKNNAD